MLKQLKVNMSDLFLAQFRELETSSRIFYYFNKMAMWDLNQLNAYFQWENWEKQKHTWLMRNFSRLVNWKGPETRPKFSQSFNCYWEIFPMVISISWPSFMTNWFLVQKICSKMSLLILIKTSPISELMEYLKMQNFECLQNAALLLY